MIEIIDNCQGCAAIWRRIVSKTKLKQMFICRMCGCVESKRIENVIKNEKI
jgi:hypothetical protein